LLEKLQSFDKEEQKKAISFLSFPENNYILDKTTKNKISLALVEILFNDIENFNIVIPCLGILQTPLSLSILQKMLKNEEPAIRLASINALAQFPGDKVLENLHKALEEEEEISIKIQIISLLGKYHDWQSLFFLEKQLQSDVPEIKAAVAYVLGNFKEKEYIPLLIDLLQEDEDIVRFSAHRSLLMLTEKNLEPIFEVWEEMKEEF
jgi:HEAT repeat protein